MGEKTYGGYTRKQIRKATTARAQMVPIGPTTSIRKGREEIFEAAVPALLDELESAEAKCIKLKKERNEARGDRATPGMYALGHALFYIKYCHPDIDFSGQLKYVHVLCDRWVDLRAREDAAFMKEFGDDEEDPGGEKFKSFVKRWAPEWNTLIEDIENETENMC